MATTTELPETSFAYLHERLGGVPLVRIRRKPAPGMLLQAAAEFDIDLSKSFMVGDAWTDVAAAVGAGVRAVLLMTGRGRWNFVPAWDRFGLNFSAACDLADATQMIKAALAGNAMNSTDRLRRSFHMALRPQDAWVL